MYVLRLQCHGIKKAVTKKLHKYSFYSYCQNILMAFFAGLYSTCIKWAPSSEFVSSSIPSWQISTAHAQPFRGARDLVFCLKVPLDSLLVWASSEGSGETVRMCRLAWTLAARIGDKYQIRLTRSKYHCTKFNISDRNIQCPLKISHEIYGIAWLSLQHNFMSNLDWRQLWLSIKGPDVFLKNCNIMM